MVAAAVGRALTLADGEPWRRERVRELAPLLHRAVNPGKAFAGSQIVPVIIGGEERALCAARALQERGFDVRAIRPPTVPEGTSRLRISLNALHTREDIAALAAAVHQVLA